MTTAHAETPSAWPYEPRARTQDSGIRVTVNVASSSREVRQVNLRPIVERPADWVPAVTERLVYLIVDAGADITQEALNAMVSVIADPIFEGSPVPLLSPAGEGGLTAEFRAGSVELHVEMDQDGQGAAYVFQEGGVEWEGPLSEVPDGLDKWAWRLGQVAP